MKTYFKKELLKKFAIFVAIGMAVFLVLYTPVIISDIKENGQNTKNFFEAITAKPEKKPLVDKISKDVSENLKYYCLLTTSECYNDNLNKNVFPIAVSALIMILGIILIVLKLRREKKQLTRDFLFLLLFWTGIFLFLTIPVSYQLRPRFYIVVFAVPFIFLGLICEFLEQRFGKKAFIASILITISILAMNARGIYLWFEEQSKSQESSFSVKRTLILKNKDGVTLGQLQRATDWIYARHRKDKNLYYYIKPEHIRPINFLLVQKNDENLNFASLKVNEDPKAQYFAITPAKNGLEPVFKKFGNDVIMIASEQIGQLMVYEIDFPNRKISETFRLKKDSGGDDRLYWKDVFNSTK